MKNLITRGICLALTLVMAFSLTACGGNSNETPATTTVPTTAPATEPTTEPVVNNGPLMNYMSLSYGESWESQYYISIIDNEDGTAYVDYQGEIRKSGSVDSSIFEELAAQLANSGLVELNGAEEWNEGEAAGSMYISYSDDSFISANYGGTVAQEFIDGYNYMDDVMQDLIAELPEYVPSATIIGDVDATVLGEIQTLIGNTSMDLDSLVINEAVMDDTFAFTTGLSTSEGIANGASCSSMMMTSAYSLVIVTVEDAANIGAVRADFEANMDWLKWVCVQPSNALIAQKDNMVICLMAMDQTYTETASAVQASGWTEIATFNNPNL